MSKQRVKLQRQSFLRKQNEVEQYFGRSAEAFSEKKGAGIWHFLYRPLCFRVKILKGLWKNRKKRLNRKEGKIKLKIGVLDLTIPYYRNDISRQDDEMKYTDQHV